MLLENNFIDEAANAMGTMIAIEMVKIIPKKTLVIDLYSLMISLKENDVIIGTTSLKAC